MKAVVIEKFGDLDEIKVQEVGEPEPQADEVKIEVRAAGANPVDWKITAGYLKDILPHQLPIVLGWDVAGTVVAVGANVDKFAVGDEVFAYCRKETVQWGTFAEYVCFTAEDVASKPVALTFEEAAAVPLVALTAWQALHDVAKIQRGQHAMIHAGAGGVGSLAIQLAKLAGARVCTTASKRNHDYVRQLGADEVIDYTQGGVPEQVKALAPDGFDFVFDCAGGQTLDESFGYTKKGGWLITITSPMDHDKAKAHGIQACNVFVRADGQELEKIRALIDSGKLMVPQIEAMPLESVVPALAKIKTGHTRGKIVLTVRG